MFIFKGKNSNEMGVYVREENFLGKAPMRYDSIEIEGKHGADLVELGYQNFEGTLNDVVIMNDNFDEVLNWLSGTGELIYMGKKTQIHFLDAYQIAKHKRTFSVPFIREPFWYDLEDDFSKPWGNNLIENSWNNFIPWGELKDLLPCPYDVTKMIKQPGVEVEFSKQRFHDFRSVVFDRIKTTGGNANSKIYIMPPSLTENATFSVFIKNNSNKDLRVFWTSQSKVIKAGELKDIVMYNSNTGLRPVDFHTIDVDSDLDFAIYSPRLVYGESRQLDIIKTPLENGLTRIRTWGGTQILKLRVTMKQELVETNTSMYIKNLGNSFKLSRWIGKASQYQVKENEDGFITFSQLSTIKNSTLEIDALKESDNLDFIASTPTIVEGDKPPTWEADEHPRIVNEGTAPSKPLIKLTKGTSSTCEFEVNGVYFKYHFNNDDHVLIDCKEMEATYEGLPRNRHLTIGFEFPVLKPGDNVVKTISGDANIGVQEKGQVAMIKLFNYKENNFNSNGIATIQPLTLMEYKETSLNGWHIETEIPIKYNNLIEEGMIALVETKSKGAQPFLISNITKTNKTLHFIAKHYVFDSINYVLEDVRPTEMSAAGALKYINDRTDIKSPFTTNSNVSGSNTAYFINKNMLEALDTIQERWGGVYDVDKFHINLKNKVGLDRGDTIMYGKNLEGLKVFEDWSNVVTKLLPVGFDGITLPETYLYSEYDYGKPYTKVIKFETELEDEDRTEETLIEELRVNALDYLKENEVPKLSYEIESNINQELGIGDTIHVKHPVVDILTEVIAYEYNILTKRITKLTFGNYKRSVKKKVDAIKDGIKEAIEKTNDFEVIINDQTNLINDMNKKGHVFIDDNQIMVLDNLPKEKAKHVWRWNMGGLGYSENGIEGPFKQAWTIDGKFNTEFIAANSIMVNQLHSDVGSSLDISANKSLNLLGDQINIVAGDVKGKLNKGEAAKDINNGTVSIRGNRINLEGYTTINKNFWVDNAGNMGARNADIQGKIMALSGSIGNMSIRNGYLVREYKTTTKKYTQTDLTRMQNIIMDKILPTDNDYLHYDIDGDGRIDTVDMVLVKKMIDNNLSPATVTYTMQVGGDSGEVKTAKSIANIGTFTAEMRGSSLDLRGITTHSVTSRDNKNVRISLYETGISIFVDNHYMFIDKTKFDADNINASGSINAYKFTMGGNSVLEYAANGQTRANLTNLHPRAGHGGAIGLSTNRYSVIYLQNQPNISSDARYKNLITAISDDLLDVVKDIKPKQYYTIYDDKVHFGYIAQDVERALYKHAYRVYGREKANQVVDDFAMLSKDESYMSLLYGEIQVLKDAYYQREIDNLTERLNKLEKDE